MVIAGCLVCCFCLVDFVVVVCLLVGLGWVWVGWVLMVFCVGWGLFIRYGMRFTLLQVVGVLCC